jgi:hypothetical protein
MGQDIKAEIILDSKGLDSSPHKSEIITNNFPSVRFAQAVNIASIVSTGGGVNENRGCPGLLSEVYMENFVSHLLRKSPNQRPVLNMTNTLDRSTPEASSQAYHSVSR